MEGNIFTSLMNVAMGILGAAIILPATVPSISGESVYFFFTSGNGIWQFD